jgi:hypothetical protein
MMQFESNPLQRELARSQQAGLHPDSDLLTAFVEGTLLERERQDVYAHLATCAYCRELLSAATGASSSPVHGLKPFLWRQSAHPPLRAWLPWASIAAGILLICSAELVHRQRLEVKRQITVAEESVPGPPATTTQQPHPGPSAASESLPGNAPTSSGPKQLKAPQPTSRNENELAANVRTEGSIAQQHASDQPRSAFVNEATARAQSSVSVSAVSPRPHWRIDSMGQTERSLGDGVWQPVLPNERAMMRVVSVSDRDVWVGGENTRLYHSSDNGNTWNIVRLPMKNGSEHVLVHIRFQTLQAGAVEASDGTSWTTTDGGASWN